MKFYSSLKWNFTVVRTKIFSSSKWNFTVVRTEIFLNRFWSNFGWLQVGEWLYVRKYRADSVTVSGPEVFQLRESGQPEVHSFNTGLPHMLVTNGSRHIIQRNTCFRHCSVSLWFLNIDSVLCMYCLKWQWHRVQITADKVTYSISCYKEKLDRQEYENWTAL
jgi:hypothetical protein